MTTTTLPARVTGGLKTEPSPWEVVFTSAVAWWAERTGRHYTAEPAHRSPIPEGTDVATALLGSQLLGLELTPQGVTVAAVLEAKDPHGLPLYDDFTGQIPRRATKTTTVQAVLLGRCETRPNYRVVQTAQDGTRASQVFMDMVRTLEARFPEESHRTWTVFKSTGREFIQWNNGSRWWVAPPRAASFRGLAADVVWIDEAGELDEKATAEVEAGALPLMDTRPDGQVIKTGTPNVRRVGLLWASLKAARETPAELGVVDYTASEAEVLELGDMGESLESDPELLERVLDLLERVHPGLSCGLTTRAKMSKRVRQMAPARFLREYLCVWPSDASTSALDLEKFARGRVEPLAAPPAGVVWALGYDVAIGGSAGTIAAAWLNKHGHPRIQIMDARPGSAWIEESAAAGMVAHPRVPLGYDPIGDNTAAAQGIARRAGRKGKGLTALRLNDVKAATALLAAANDRETLEWSASPALERAVTSAGWRESNGSRLFRRINGQDISALLAAVHALAALSTIKRRRAPAPPAPPESSHPLVQNYAAALEAALREGLAEEPAAEVEESEPSPAPRRRRRALVA